ncbi:hypothetical protein AB6A40_004874 [Gnathostoma spinigerum]|uniref:DUF7027 domain-containing protein n=1 Tax=Gnathostoma spinigerum TaxID=75299 RepID=A0ABD6EPI2_9BILA
MDFDPDHQKWRCCCCQLTSGLTIMASIEMFIASAILSVSAVKVSQFPLDHNSTEISIFEVLLVPICVLWILTSSLLILGIHKLKIQWMYPTIAVRALTIIFVQACGVSVVVGQRITNKIGETSVLFSNEATGVVKKSEEKDGAYLAQYFVLLVFFMIFVSFFVVYTIYLIVRCTQFVRGRRKLAARRMSTLMAGKIGQYVSQECLEGRNSVIYVPDLTA